MTYHINIYENNSVRTVPVSLTQKFSFGEGPSCTHRFPQGTCPGSSIQFSYENGSWRAFAAGNVVRAGRPISDTLVRNGELFILDQRSRVAVQLVWQENQALVQISLEGYTELSVGRKEQCAIQLKDGRVSGSHARLYRSEGKWRISDLNSSNGTYINGRRITDQQLESGDRILIGCFDLIFTGELLEIHGEKGSQALHLPKRSGLDIPVTPPPKPKEVKRYPMFTRSPRLIRERPTGKVEIEAAPNIGSKPEINWLTVLLPPMATLGLTLIVTILTGMSPLGLVFTGPMMIIGIVTAALNYQAQTKKYMQKETLLKEKYQQYLLDNEEKLKQAAVQQRQAALWSNPSPQECVDMAVKTNRRLWERTVGDRDFLSLRAGVGTEPLCIEVHTPKVGFMLEEDSFTRAPQQLAEKYRSVDGVPVCCDLLHLPTLGIIGERNQTVGAAQMLAVQAATHHGYDEVKLVVLFPEKEKDQWMWMRWLPHTWSDDRSRRYMACKKYDAVQMLAPIEEELKQRMPSGAEGWDQPMAPVPYYVFFVADSSLLQNQSVMDLLLQNNPALGVSCILLAQDIGRLPYSVMQILEARTRDSALYPRNRAEEKHYLQPDHLDAASCEAFARTLAPVRLPQQDSAQLLPSCVTFLEGYHVKRPEQLDIGEFWEESCCYKSMSVPIAVRANGENFYFNIHEKAHGPHGLVTGTTGSGKTEMVQSWILSMAIQFSPQDVNFVLIDFKGTGLILPFVDLPHLAGTISDLDTNISRNLIALRSEAQRRKIMMDNAKVNPVNIIEYQKLYRSGKVKEPMPFLFLIIDEYAAFKTQFPDFTSEINTLIQTGRSLGIYIILMTQNPAGIVTSQTENNVKFRWGLRVVSAGDSKEALGGGHDEASRISLTNPGRGYVRVGNDEIFELVQSFYSNAHYQPEGKDTSGSSNVISRIGLDGSRTRISEASAAKAVSIGTEIEAVVSYIRKYTARKHIKGARAIWSERLPQKLYLPGLLECVPDHQKGELCPVIGLIDDPAAQTQRALAVPFSGSGHLAVYGGPGTGKTVLLQTLITSLTMKYSPEEVNIYIMDFNSWSMGMFHNFPHVAGIAKEDEGDRIDAIAKTMEHSLQKRKELFSREGVGNLKTYCQVTGEPLPYLVLVVDGLSNDLYQNYPQLEELFLRIGQGGSNYGIYLAVSGSTANIGYKLTQYIKTNLVLELADSSGYANYLGKTGGLLPESTPGRGLCRSGQVLEFQTALPAPTEDGTFIMAIRALGKELCEKWGSGANVLTVMPDVVEFGSIKPQNGGFVLGLGIDSLQPVEIGLDAPHYLLVSGLPQSGKTTLLAALARQMLEREGARVVLFAKPEEYHMCKGQMEFLESGEAADQFLAKLASLLKERQAQKKQNPDQTFSPVYLLIDGYRHFFEEVAQQSIDRLKALVMIGAGLGVAVAAADKAESISALVQYKESLTTLLAKGPAVLLGGKPLDHQAVELPLEPAQKNFLMKQQEGCYKSKEGVVRFRAMNAGE